jgi:predicted transcriptional regulator
MSQIKFAELLGITQPAVSGAVKRGTVIHGIDGIDTDDPTNQKYMRAVEKRQDRRRNAYGKKGSTDQQKRADERANKQIRKIQHEYDTRLSVPENTAPVSLDLLNDANVSDYAKVDIDKLKIIEQTKIYRLKALKERGKLLDAANVKTIFGKIVSIEENELKTIPDSITTQLIGYFGNDDPEVSNEVRKKLEKEIFKVLRRIKSTVNDYLVENRCA